MVLFSQSAEFINGKVINTNTHEPVAFATIKLKYNQLGVYANAEGDFKISLNPEFNSDSLIITCIGFKRNSTAFKDLHVKELNQISLSPHIYGLAEVKVTASGKRLGSVSIISRAIKNIQKNYPHKPFSYISYYRDYQKRDSTYINLNEGIVQTQDHGFDAESVSSKYRLLDFKKNTDFQRMNMSPYYETDPSENTDNSQKKIPDAHLGDQYGNELFILMVHDAIRNFKRRSFSFIEIFSDDFILNHNFSRPATVYDNNLLLYKINFNAKNEIIPSRLKASGAIYIQPKTYAIYKLEYSCSYPATHSELGEMFNIDIEYGHENQSDSLMYLKYISFNNFFKVIDKDDNSYFRVLDAYWDTEHYINPTIIVNFNNNINPRSAASPMNYKVFAGKKTIKIASIQTRGKTLYIRTKSEDIGSSKDSCQISLHNIKDTDGNILDKRKSIGLYQYRELFVQEYNRNLPFADSCIMQYLPLELNCVSKYNGSYNYWMNTPANIKINR